MRRRRWMPWAGGVLLVLGSLLMLIGALRLGSRWTEGFLGGRTPTPDPLVPTRTPAPVSPLGTPGFDSPLQTPSLDATHSSEVAPVVVQWTVPQQERSRLCVSLPSDPLEPAVDYDLAALEVGWVLDWYARPALDVPEDVEYVRMVRMSEDELTPDVRAVQSVAAANPGGIWLISNEPDVPWQDNVIPETYAQLYHDAYVAIKAGDPTAVVAAGGIAQPTSLRLRYLDLVLEAYIARYETSLPADAWQIHNYMLREERDSWGVGIPPGLPDDAGMLYTIDDSGSLEIFRSQIMAFRQWLARRGYGTLPLYVTEFGIPMPADYGFPPERVATFLGETWHYLLTATDPTFGDPADGGRLVQRWCWFSIAYPQYPTGNLVDPDTKVWTSLGRTWLAYVRD